MDFIIANDLHWGSPHELTSEKTLDLFIKEQPSNLILCGDIVDLYNCHPQRIDKAKGAIIALKKIYGDRYLMGNHELYTEGPRLYKYGNILFTHGHYFDWDRKKVLEWENNKQPAQGRSILSPIWNTVRKLRPSFLTKLDKTRAVNLARSHGCDIVVSGHYHMKNIYRHTEDGVTIVIFPPGVNIMRTEPKKELIQGELAKILPFRPVLV